MALRILCVHGVGDHHSDLSWQADWQVTVESAVRRWDPGAAPEFHFIAYDDIFEQHPITIGGTAEALAKLLKSGVVAGLATLGERITGIFRHQRGLFGGLSEKVRWSAGMVVQWVENDRLRKATRARLLDAVDEHEPDAILAHSLGSLVTYDTFSLKENRARLDGRTVVTFGSQIANPFVRGSFGGRIRPLEAKRWFHLYNDEDEVFTAPIRLEDPRFQQIETHFDIEGVDHDALEYLGHPNAVQRTWRELAGPRGRDVARGAAVRAVEALRPRAKRRALLVGINEYPDPKDRLEGCLNDVFLMSSLLQEMGFRPDDIRIVLDDRATTKGILERLDWLVDGTRAGDERFFFYSGHGAQIPTYGVGEVVDGIDECLVPCDFDWSPEHAVTDDRFFEFYTQLPYDARFLAVLDCCHSGGMHRDGGPRVRGIAPPDDIRHRALKWNARFQMWEDREVPSENRSLDADYAGRTKAKRRLGRAVTLRSLGTRAYDSERERRDHYGPYLPILYQACQEDQLASEYVHGVTSYGAFTYCLAQTLREKKRISFQGLRDETARRLKKLGYDQVPTVLGPKKFLSKPVPWKPATERVR
jgi:hypothetical protein